MEEEKIVDFAEDGTDGTDYDIQEINYSPEDQKKERFFSKEELSEVEFEDDETTRKRLNPEVPEKNIPKYVSYPSGVPVKYCKVIVQNNDIYDNVSLGKYVMTSRGPCGVLFNTPWEVSEETYNNLQAKTIVHEMVNDRSREMRTREVRRYIVERISKFYVKKIKIPA